MIRDDDADFHAPDPAHPTWAETNYFGFYNAEEHLNVGVYALFRPNLGTVTTSVCMNSRRTVTHWEADFCDMRAAVPIPQPRNLRDYALSSGLHVRCRTRLGRAPVASTMMEGSRGVSPFGGRRQGSWHWSRRSAPAFVAGNGRLAAGVRRAL